MTDQERQLRAALNAQRFSEEVARQVVGRRNNRSRVITSIRATVRDTGRVSIALKDIAKARRQAQQRATFGER